jgi:hypothetical protein
VVVGLVLGDWYLWTLQERALALDVPGLVELMIRNHPGERPDVLVIRPRRNI